ncbi:MAG: segregation/condensation protein A [Candidatus Omnitrophica bacterium]|nr:segregation/condensation protein A [Candidatus Omnitrophota bacterium]
MMGYKIRLDIFEGPLDLLLYLIRKNDLDIQNIPIASITEQYMRFIEVMQILDLDLIGDFLVMAATLMHIKSRMLLPLENNEEEKNPDDPKEELIRRLAEYQRFKEIAGELEQKEKARKDLFPRPPDDEQKRQWKEEAKEVYHDTNLFDLISALSEALKKIPEDLVHEIMKEEYTVESKVQYITETLLDQERMYLNELFGHCRSKMEIVVTFLAILELIRLKQIKAVQKRAFENIEIIRVVVEVVNAVEVVKENAFDGKIND